MISALVVIVPSQHICAGLRQSCWQVQDSEGGAMSPELLGMLRKGQQPLDAYEAPLVKARISAALSRILVSCHQQFAGITITRHALHSHLLGLWVNNSDLSVADACQGVSACCCVVV